MEAGADAMVTPCPLCHLSLDAWQQKLEASTGRAFQMPILHLSQLIGVAAGLEDSELQVQAPRRPRDAGAREARSLIGPAARGRCRRWGRRARGVGLVRGGVGAAGARRTSRLPGLPPELDGLRIAHLSDFHLGAAVARGAARSSGRSTGWRSDSPT